MIREAAEHEQQAIHENRVTEHGVVPRELPLGLPSARTGIVNLGGNVDGIKGVPNGLLAANGHDPEIGRGLVVNQSEDVGMGHAGKDRDYGPGKEIADDIFARVLPGGGDDEAAVGGVDVVKRRGEGEGKPAGAGGEVSSGQAVATAVGEEEEEQVVAVAGGTPTAEGGVGVEERGGADGVEEGSREGLAEEERGDGKAEKDRALEVVGEPIPLEGGRHGRLATEKLSSTPRWSELGSRRPNNKMIEEYIKKYY